MTSSVPKEWLEPCKLENGWRFVCSTSLRNLVATDLAASFFRQLVNLIENEYHLENFHFKIHHNRKQHNRMEVSIFCGDDHTKQQMEPVVICMSCEPTHELSRTTLISEQTHTFAWLDCRNRSKLIVTPRRHVERLSQLNDDNGEMKAFWADTVQLIDDFNYPNLAINHGSLRKHGHLHLKIDLSKDIWETKIVRQHQQQLNHLAELLKQTDQIRSCFTETHLQKEIEKGVIGMN